VSKKIKTKQSFLGKTFIQGHSLNITKSAN